MNMNQMNMMVGNINNINQQMNKKIQLIIKSENNKLDIISCLENDKVSTLKNLLNLNGRYLLHNYKLLSDDFTIKEQEIGNRSIINIKYDVINLLFYVQTNNPIILILDEDCPLNIAISFYCIKSQTNYSQICNGSTRFLYNNMKLPYNDETSIKNIFKGRSIKNFVNKCIK